MALLGLGIPRNLEGNRVIIGGNPHYGLHGGYARVFEERDGKWIQIGQDLNGSNSSDFFGASVAMNDEENRVIIGGRCNNGVSGGRSGHARVFEERGRNVGAD